MAVSITELHRALYHRLADEYEERADALREVTAGALAPFVAQLPPGGRVLDVGCGVGLVSELLANAGFETVAIDLSERMVAYTRRRSPRTFALADDYAEHTFARGFDGIVAFALIHLFPTGQAERVLAKMHADLAPGGLLYVGATESAESREGFETRADSAVVPARFRRHWTRAELAAALARAGFAPVSTATHVDRLGERRMGLTVRRA